METNETRGVNNTRITLEDLNMNASSELSNNAPFVFFFIENIKKYSSENINSLDSIVSLRCRFSAFGLMSIQYASCFAADKFITFLENGAAV